MASLNEAPLPLALALRARFQAWLCRVLGYFVLAACVACAMSLLSWSAADPSFTHASSGPTRNLLGPIGAILSDLIVQLFGLSGVLLMLPPLFWGLQLITIGKLDRARATLAIAPVALVLLACAASALPTTGSWPLPYGFGGLLGDQTMKLVGGVLAMLRPERASAAGGLFCLAGGLTLLAKSCGLSHRDLHVIFYRPSLRSVRPKLRCWLDRPSNLRDLVRREPTLRMPPIWGREERALVQMPAVALPSTYGTPGPHVAAGERPYMAPTGIEQPVDETSDIARRFAPARRRQDENKRRESDLWPEDTSDNTSAAFPRQSEAGFSQPPPHPRGELVHSADEPSYCDREDIPADDLYGRAVAIVLGDRKASTRYLQQRLAIGYMRASDLIERMERDGILGAPIYNGMRPILLDGSGSNEV
jgi:S-DNA-T family DNA segregation ATPase FtsK/SpoIIIE